MTDDLVKEYYSTEVLGEWHRLVRDAYHQLEFNTTLHFLAKYLPPHGLILDAGGGPGRYTLELAKQGYNIVLLDASQPSLDFARRQVKRRGLQDHVKEIIPGSVVDLSRFSDSTFDAVICTGGPLSHLLDPHHRQLAISELTRVVKPGAPIFVSVIGRLGTLTVILIEESDEIELPYFKQLLESGDYLGGHGFTACHFYLPEELRVEFTREGIQIVELAGLEGLSSHHAKELNRLAKEESSFRIWLETHYQTCTHPAVVGISDHMLIVCRKNM